MNLNQVTLPVIKMSPACEFYLKLGCLQIVDTPHYARFESPIGDSTFSLSLNDNGCSRGVALYFEVDNVDKTVALLTKRGLSFCHGPEDKSWLWREAQIKDPSGNVIKIYHAGDARRNPPWRVEKTS